jgi:hypothetical protein
MATRRTAKKVIPALESAFIFFASLIGERHF